MNNDCTMREKLNMVYEELQSLVDEFELEAITQYDEYLANNEEMLEKAVRISWLAKDISDYFKNLFVKTLDK